jgi:hypothetical protein
MMMSDTYDGAVEIREEIQRQGEELRDVVREGLRALVAVQFYRLTPLEMVEIRPEIARFMGWH